EREVNLRQLLRALIARRRVFFVALGAVVLAATLASLMMPKSYRATVSLLVDTRDEQSLGDALRPLVLPQERMSYLQTQVDILTSPKIANAYAQAYVDTMLELRVAPTRKAAAWFDEQLKGLRANLEDAQAKLAQAKLAVQAKATQHPESIPRVVDNAFVQQLKGELLHG